MDKIEYFHDSDRFVAAINEGSRGYFMCTGSAPNFSEWRYIVPGSIAWDSLDQDIRYSHHDFDPCPPELSAALPPLPAIPSSKPLAWKDNFEPKEPLRAGDFPALGRRIAEMPDGKARFWFILEEDLYESRYGDGSFLYFHGLVFESEESARASAEAHNLETARRERLDGSVGSEYSIRGFVVSIEAGRLKPSEYEPRNFEHHEIEEILRRIEATIASTGTPAWGKRRA
jgi:hypothetical protein